jgi:hypothetical protein
VTVTLELNQDLGRQSVPMVIEVLDNFVFDLAVARIQHGTQKLVPHGLALARHPAPAEGCNPFTHYGHGDLPSNLGAS